ncbi:MAG: PilZ domain-containing protein [Deltaproteobacteria bacterium]|nr:PilZ domain-containing protein [Deltaproteobacteria bacterium]
MADIRSEQKKVSVERREHPRLELHCTASVLGLTGVQKITDISLGGIFIEAEIPGKLKLGQTIVVNTKLPTERSAIKFKAKIVSQTKRGIGCRFIALKDHERDAICLCFEMYKDTLPAGCD